MSKEDTVYFKGRRDKDGNLSQDSEEYRKWKAGAEIVHLCPRGCKGSLKKKDGLLTCNECDGVKVSVETLAEGTRDLFQKFTEEHKTKDTLLEFIRQGQEGDLTCPLCNKKMVEIGIEYDPNQASEYRPILGGFVGGGGDHPIIILIGLVILSVEVISITSHVAQRVNAKIKDETSTITLDGCACCESMWFDGPRFSDSPTDSINHEFAIIERFWASTEKSKATNRLDEKKTEDNAEKLLEKEREKERKKREAKKKEEARRAALTPEQRQAEDDKKDDNRPYWQRYDNL
jgi:hypothetical protein